MTKREARIKALGEAIGKLDSDLDSGGFLYNCPNTGLDDDDPDKAKIDAAMDDLIVSLRRRLAKLQSESEE